MEANEAAVSLLGGLVSLFFALAIFLVMMWPYVKIIQKAGYSGWHALWMFVPIANLVMLFVFAFSRWPIEDKVERLESRVF
jgi:uncharacterized membrane protein YhaH (DUF805 family)